jgi:hypothetical protein
MMGCFMLLVGTGFFTVIGIYMSSLTAYFVTLATTMGIYMAGMASYFTAFFIIMFG